MRSGTRSAIFIALIVITLSVLTSQVSQAQCQDINGRSPYLYLRGAGPSLQLYPVVTDDSLEATGLPGPTTFLESPRLRKSGAATPDYTPIGSWPILPAWSECDGVALVMRPHVWLGLRNSDDEGTKFDLMFEVFAGSERVAQGEVLCVSGITKNPAKAKELVIGNSLGYGEPDLIRLHDQFSPTFSLDGTRPLSLRLSARIGSDYVLSYTNQTVSCKGHANAAGLRVYYGSQLARSRVRLAGSFINSVPCDPAPCDIFSNPNCCPAVAEPCNPSPTCNTLVDPNCCFCDPSPDCDPFVSTNCCFWQLAPVRD